jgi:hypothetical protein
MYGQIRFADNTIRIYSSLSVNIRMPNRQALRSRPERETT